MHTNIITPEEALFWLAGLKKLCLDCKGKGKFYHQEEEPADICLTCDGSGKTPALDLREPCGHNRQLHWHTASGCLGWFPKKGRDALHQAMERDGWYYSIFQEGYRVVIFWRWKETRPPIVTKVDGTDSNDWIAAMKAMQAVGYGKDNGYTT